MYNSVQRLSLFFSFFSTAPATTEIYTLSLHDALPIHELRVRRRAHRDRLGAVPRRLLPGRARVHRSEEHTSELQSLTNLVCRLLLEKKKLYRRRCGLCSCVADAGTIYA